jgi:hypothetical protein
VNPIGICQTCLSVTIPCTEYGDDEKMNGLFGVGIVSVIIGAVLLYFGFGDNVSASTQFGDFEGPIGAVAVIVGIVLMAIGAM